MSKAEKPTLAGHRSRTRKRDEKVKFDPAAFRDELVEHINQAGDMDALERYIESAGNNLDYRRYADQFFDILIAGALLAPGGSVVSDGAPASKFSVFGCEDDAGVKQFSDMVDRVLRRYKYMQVLLEEHCEKVLKFLKAFTELQRSMLAKFVSQLMVTGILSSKPLASLFLDTLAKDGLSEEFMFNIFRSWLKVSSINSLATSFRKGGIDQKLDMIYPINKRSQEHLLQRVKEAGDLGDILTWLNSQRSSAIKRDLQEQLTEALRNDQRQSELIALAKQLMSVSALKEHDVVTIVWTAVMDSVDWNKKADLVAEQALRQVNTCVPLLTAFTTTERAQKMLLVKIQNYFYENQTLLKVFMKVILLLYHHSVLDETPILEWYDKDHSSKGRSVFLEQMAEMVQWLKTAETEE
jgi:hypothetical protein